MKNIYSCYGDDETWNIRESEWVTKLQAVRESQFALGNGYLGMRGVLEEIPHGAQPGTYLSGLYDKMASQVDELVNLPNPINFKFTVEGEKLDLYAMDVTDHTRVLNMKKGMLLRQTMYSDTTKRRYDYQSVRFVSMHNKHIGVMQMTLTPLDGACVLDINTGIDTSVDNVEILSEGSKKHFRVKELGTSHKAGYLTVDTMEKHNTIVFWSGFYYEKDGKKVYAKDNIFRLKLRKNQTVTFTKIFCIKHFPYKHDCESYRKETFKVFYNAFHGNFTTLAANHIKAWERTWKKADVLVFATEHLQMRIRFNIYHMLICAHYDSGFSSVGARTLSGEGYRGHIFWDAEIFNMPFYLFKFPNIAKNMLMYRYRRLDVSREIAERDGFKGARYAWESARTGEEQTPEWARDFDGTVIKIHTHDYEIHITADIAYALYKYYVVTGDEEFMNHYGYEMLFETARFWVSRAQYNKRKKRYDINNVIGPDEFHVDVNNNAFTNMMVKWHLLTAARMYKALKNNKKVAKTLKEKLKLKDVEVREWGKVARGLYFNINKKTNIIEQFEGYYKLKNVEVEETDENGMPILPSRYKAEDLDKTKYVKQADVVMLLCLLDDVFNLKTKKENYNYYVPKTLHKSSLSCSMHALLACEVGDMKRAYDLFNVALRTDISDSYGNTKEGIHAASLGGTWQVLVHGFGGVGIFKETLSINPRMPRSWSKMCFAVSWKHHTVKLELTNNLIKVRIGTKDKKMIEIGIFGKRVQIKPNKVHIFTRKNLKSNEEYYY